MSGKTTFISCYLLLFCLLTVFQAHAEEATELPMPNWQLLSSSVSNENKYQHLKDYNQKLITMTGYLDQGAAYAALVERGKNEQRVNLITQVSTPYKASDPLAAYLWATMTHWRGFAAFNRMMEQAEDDQDPAVRQRLLASYLATLSSSEEQLAMATFQASCSQQHFVSACLAYLAGLNEQSMLCIMANTPCGPLLEQLALAEQQLSQAAKNLYAENINHRQEMALLLAMIYGGELMPVPESIAEQYDFPRDNAVAEQWQQKQFK